MQKEKGIFVILVHIVKKIRGFSFCQLLFFYQLSCFFIQFSPVFCLPQECRSLFQRQRGTVAEVVVCAALFWQSSINRGSSTRGSSQLGKFPNDLTDFQKLFPSFLYSAPVYSKKRVCVLVMLLTGGGGLGLLLLLPHVQDHPRRPRRENSSQQSAGQLLCSKQSLKKSYLSE